MAQAIREEMRAQLDPEDLKQFAIRGAEADFEEALGGRTPTPGTLHVKSSGTLSSGIMAYSRVCQVARI